MPDRRSDANTIHILYRVIKILFVLSYLSACHTAQNQNTHIPLDEISAAMTKTIPFTTKFVFTYHHTCVKQIGNVNNIQAKWRQ